MIDRALEIWRMPSTDYVPQEKVLDKVTLADDYPLTGKSIGSYEFFGASKNVKNWKEMYVDVVGLVFDKDPHILIEQVNRNENPLFLF